MNKVFAARLKALRKEHNMTQQDVADRLGVNKQTISGYERGLRRPDFEKLDELADTFDVSIGYLIGAAPSGAYPRHGTVVRVAEVPEQKRDALTDEERAVLEAYRAASKDIKGAVRAVLGVEK